MSENDKKVTLDGEEISIQELEEKKNNLEKNERIVESAPDIYQSLQRMNG